MSPLSPDMWRSLESAHHERVDAVVRDHLARRARQVEHPVEDFLFTYYAHSPGRLRRWHPGHGVALAEAPERASWSGYRCVGRVAQADVARLVVAKAGLLRATAGLLRATARRPSQLGCFGMHEWAMAYRADETTGVGPTRAPGGLRHAGWPLRLGAEGTDAVVESTPLRCSHFDAYRFFTPAAEPLNSLRPRADTRADLEQPGCLHATMDLYKLGFRLTPLVPSELLMDCFDLALEVRAVDMRASPYDLSELGYLPIAVETAQGKAEYVAHQRAFAERGQLLRARLLEVVDGLATASPGRPDPPDEPVRPAASDAQRTGTD